MRENLNAVIFAGAIWGIAEATFGWMLHLLHIHHVALWLSPVIIGCIAFAFKATGRASSVLYAAIVAALIKCTDLLLPINVPAYYVLNPAMYIVAEGIVGALMIKLLNLKQMPRLRFALTSRISSVALVLAIAVNLLLFAWR